MRLGEKLRDAAEQNVLGIFAGLRQHVLAVEPGLDVAAAKIGRDHLLDIFGEAFLDDQYRFLVGAEAADLLRHQRIGDVEAQQRHAAFAEQVGQAEPLERAQRAVIETALHDDADILQVAREEFVQLLAAG